MVLRKLNRLSNRQIKAMNKQGNYADGGGLYLQVSKFKSKSWIFRFTINKRSREMGLGSLLTVSITEARLDADHCRRLVRKGIDPIEDRRLMFTDKVIRTGKNIVKPSSRTSEEHLNKIISAIREEFEPHKMLYIAAMKITRILGVAGCRVYRFDNSENLCIAIEYGAVKRIEGFELELSLLKNSQKSFEAGFKNYQFLTATTNYRKRINGAISIWRLSGKGRWGKNQHFLIKNVAKQLGVANEQISNHERMLALSRTDSMTGLLNRRAFYEEDLPRRISRLKVSGEMAALFFVDMDNFKLVNDAHGHRAGDDALLLLRDLMMDISRPGDVIARLGGDEFAMWLDGVSPDVTRKRAEDLIEASKCLKQFSGDEKFPLGISVGVAIYNPKDNETLEELVARADAAMYQVKNADKQGFLLATLQSF